MHVASLGHPTVEDEPEVEEAVDEESVDVDWLDDGGLQVPPGFT